MANTFKSATAANIGTSPTTIYTCPALTVTTVIGLSVANVLTAFSSLNVNIRLFKNGGDTVYIVKGGEVSIGSSLIAVGGDQKVVLQPGDYIQVSASEPTAVDVIISVLEIS